MPALGLPERVGRRTTFAPFAESSTRLPRVGGGGSYWLRYRGHRIPVRGAETVLGRSPYCSVVINSPLVSRRHCALRAEAHGLVLVDLGSTNGTRLNDRQVTAATVATHGDVLRLGSERIELIELGDTETGSGTTRSRLEAATDPPREPEPLTQTENDTLELIEALVAQRPRGEAPLRIAATVRRVVDQWLEAAGGAPHLLPSAIAERLGAAADRVAAWARHGDFEAWRTDVRSRLGLKPRDGARDEP